MAYRILKPAEEARLAGLDKRFQKVARAVVDDLNLACTEENCSVHVAFGTRTNAEQLKLWAKGRTMIEGQWKVTDAKAVVTRAAPGSSPHNFGLAVDVPLLRDSDGKWLPGHDRRWDTIVRRIVELHGLVWGGNFKGLRDCAHFEHPQWKTMREGR